MVFLRRISRIFTLYTTYFLTVFATQKSSENQYVYTFLGFLLGPLQRVLVQQTPTPPLDAVVPGFTMR